MDECIYFDPQEDGKMDVQMDKCKNWWMNELIWNG